MAISTWTTTFFVLSLVFFVVAVIGNSKIAFVEVNPGCFGRLLSLFFGAITLAVAVYLVIFPSPTFEAFKIQFAQLLQQNISYITQYITEFIQNS